MAVAFVAVFSFLPIAVFGAGTPAFVQERDSRVSSGKAVTVTPSSSTTSGNLVVVYVVWDNTGTVSLTDSAGNTYISAAGPAKWNGNRYGAQTFYAKNVKGGPDTVTAAFSTAVKSFGEIYLIEYSGLGQSGPFEASVAAIGSSGSLNSGSVTTTNASDLLFAAGVSVNNVTSPGPGFIVRSTSNGDMIMDKNVSSPGTYNATAGNSGGAWAMQMVAFKAAIGAQDTTPPTVPANVTAVAVGGSQVTLNWQASTDNVGVTGYLVERSQGTGSTAFAQVGTVATTNYTDAGLLAGTVYNYRVRATDAAGNLSGYSSVSSATTAPAPDTTPPTAPANVTAVAVGGSQVTLNWQASTDNVAIAGYRVYRNGSQVATTTSTSFSDTGLINGTTYTYAVAAYDAAGNVSAQSATASATTPDTAPPSVPTGLTATAVSSLQINLAWNVSTDNVAVAGYRVYRNGSQVATTTSTSYSDTGLVNGTTYTYAVAAYDAAGNVSAQSATASAATLPQTLPTISSFGANPSSIIAGQVTTLSWVVSNSTFVTVNPGAGIVTASGYAMLSPATTTIYTLTATNNAGSATAQTNVTVSPDTIAPTVPANLTAAAITPSQINLSWTASSDNVGVAGYQIYRNGVVIGTTNATAYSDAGLAPGTTYTYAVAAYDAAGNVSAQSATANATTLALSSGYYATTFPLTENPVSEGGNWLSGAAVGLDWCDIRTTPGFAFGTQTGNINYNDSIANLTGSWGPNQMAQATVRIVNSDSAQFEEVELLLRRSLSAHNATGYEINFSVKPGNPYAQIVRWNGALGDWTSLNATGVGVQDGDVVSATIVSNVITAYINGTNVLQATDGTYPTGSPGMSFYLQNGSSNFDGDFGFSSFMASDGSAPDTQAPTVPANLAAVAVSSSQINLAWAASTDNVGVMSYQIYRNGAVIATTNATSYSDVGLAANTAYTYNIAAFDAAGNHSAQSAGASATTPSATDTSPPSVPTSLQSVNVSSVSATITWNASTDNVAVAGYLVFRNGNQVGNTALTSFTDAGLAASTTYSYTVAAYDASGNVSAQSALLSLTTASAASKPPSFVQVNNNQIASGTGASATFKSSTQAGNTIVAYVIWSNTGNVTLTDSRGDTFLAPASPVTWGANYRAQVFYAANIAGGTDTVTATFQNAVSSFGVIYIHEYSGINPVTPLDVTVTASGSGQTLNSGTAVTTQPNDLVFGAGVSDNTVTAAGSGFTARSTEYGNITEDRTAASTGSYGATASQNGSAWGMQMVAFRPAN